MDDLIYRQAAIDALESIGSLDTEADKKYAISVFEALPSVERKKGKWIKNMRVTKTKKYTSYDPEWCCACCGAKYDSHVAKIVNFCYVCGADMRGEQNDND